MFYFLFPVVFFLAGCSTSVVTPQSTTLETLAPYLTRTPVIIPTMTVPVTETPTPTPTPVLYHVTASDTMIGIATRFDVTLDELLAANPGVIPQSLAIGQELIIPSASQGSAAISAVTPVPLEPGPAFCQASGTGTTCLIPVRNPYPQPLENVSLLVTLVDEQGQLLESVEAVLPLNILPSQGALPAGVFFDKQISNPSARVQLLTSMLIEPGDSRYLKTDIRNLLVSTNWDGLSADLQAEVYLPETEQPAISLWLVAVAYNAGGQIVGFRRLEWNDTIQPGDSRIFTLSVYSLGPAIERVDLLVEARP